MNPSAFEQLCWWLLRKEHNLTGCKRLGGSGHAQGGIDLFAYDMSSADALIVFECKCWKDYAPSKMTDAIKTFLAGEWKTKTQKFVLILAQPAVGPALGQRWQKERDKLKSVGIDSELWSGDELTYKIQKYPDILSKFFPGYNVEFFANEWMNRVGFYEELNKAFFDPREHIKAWARKIPSGTNGSGEIEQELVIDGNIRKISYSEGHWVFDGPWFSITNVSGSSVR